MTRQSDVVIIGGGLAGLTLALQLRMTLPVLSVTVLERHRHPAPETTFKVGESDEPTANFPTIHLPTYHVDRGRLENDLLARCRAAGAEKVAWDTAFYFAYNILLFCNGRFCDPVFHQAIREENARLESLQQRMRYRFKRSEVEQIAYSGHFIDQACVEPIQALYQSSKDRLEDTEGLKARLGENIQVLEHFSNTIEELVR